MDTSFLTFSPKALAKKKFSGNIVRGPLKSRFFKQKISPLKDVCSSPSNLQNIKRNGRESVDCKTKTSGTIILEDSIEVISESSQGIEKITDSYKQLFTHCEKRSSGKNCILSAKTVKEKQLQNSDDKFEEIRNWLSELHSDYEKKRLTPPWSSSASNSVVLCSPTPDENVPNSEKKNFTNWRIPETSSDESENSMSQKKLPSLVPTLLSPTPVRKVSSDIIELGSSSDESVKAVRRKKVRLAYSSNESDDGSSNHSQPSLGKGTYDSVSLGKLSKASSDLCQQLSTSSSAKECDKSSGSSSRDDESIISTTSADRIISSLYGTTWDKGVLTPTVEKKKFKVKTSPKKNLVSIEKTLSQFYGDCYDRAKVLTPTVNRKGIRKGKENTPPVIGKRATVETSPKRNKPKTKLPINNINKITPKAISGTSIKHPKPQEPHSFLQSLSACSPRRCNPKALSYKRNFKKNKDELISDLFRLFNAEVFEKKLPFNLKISWNAHMSKTAGYCYFSSVLGSQGKLRSARIELSTKVCSSCDRVRDTLIHEMCHAAVWIVDGIKGAHGPEWKLWARKAMRRFPELPRIGRCHDYHIETKYIYKCKNCGYSIGRHSKSLDLQRKRCGYCYGEFELLVNVKTKSADAGVKSTPRTPRAATGFALYVKENYKAAKEKHSGLKHAEIMKLLGSQFASVKVSAAQ